MIYLDGVKAGEMRFPGGEVGLTAACRPGRKQTLSMFVQALPLNALMRLFNDSAAPPKVESRVERRGLLGDLYLVGEPAGARMTDVRVETSVRRWQITFDAALAGLDRGAGYMLRAQISETSETGDAGRRVTEFTSAPFQSNELVDGRIRVTENWRPDKLWDTHTPQNQYDLNLSLLDSSGKVLDTALARPLRIPRILDRWKRFLSERNAYLSGRRPD